MPEEFDTQVKARFFAGLVVEDAAPINWRDQLKATHGMFAVSPLHTPDNDDSYSHYHVIYRHPNTISISAVRRLLPKGVFKNDYVMPIHHPRNYQRYLIHLDDPNKQQFSDGREAIDLINGFPLDLKRDFSGEELAKQRADVFEIIREQNMTEYAELIDYLMDSGYIDLLDYACKNTVLFDKYITSRRHSAE